MAKQNGLGMTWWVGGVDLSGDTQSFGRIAGGVAPLDVTSIDLRAHARIGALHDAGIDAVSFFNPTAGAAHPTLSALPTGNVIVTAGVGTTLGYPAASLLTKQVDYAGTRAQGGEFTFSVPRQGNLYPLDWGVQLTAGKRTDTAATNGATVDQTTASTSFGWQAYAHVFAVTGTSVTLTLEDSANGTDWTPLTGGAFTAVTAPGPGSQRLAGGTTATVRRYVRVTSSGTFNPGVFAVAFTRNLTARD